MYFVADIHGKIRIWDTVNKEHLLKAEYQPFVGVVRDLVWSPDSTKLAVVGEGRDMSVLSLFLFSLIIIIFFYFLFFFNIYFFYFYLFQYILGNIFT